MKLRWGKEKIQVISSPLKKAEEVNEWAWWGLFVTTIVMGALFILKILGKI